MPQHLVSFAFQTGRLAIWLALLTVIFVPLERLCALHPAKIWRKQIGVDIAYYFINSLLPAALLSLPLAFLARALRGLDPGGYYSSVALWPLWLKAPLILFVSDFGVYWGHRALHGIPVLWRFHAIHHSAEEMDWLVNTRAHPVDMVLVRLSGFTPVYLLGLAQATGSRLDPTVVIVTLFGILWTFFIHSNIRVRLGPLEWLISSPAFHHWHHCDNQCRERNYAFVFPVIDYMFGTAWLPKQWPAGYGVDEKIPPTLAGQFFEPFEPATGRESK